MCKYRHFVDYLRVLSSELTHQGSTMDNNIGSSTDPASRDESALPAEKKTGGKTGFSSPEDSNPNNIIPGASQCSCRLGINLLLLKLVIFNPRSGLTMGLPILP